MNTRNRKHGWMFVLPWDIDGIGGVNIVVTELYKAFSKYSDFHPYILILDWDAKEPKIIEKQSYTEIRFRLREPLTKGMSPFKSIAAYFASLPRTLLGLKRLIKKNNITVINPHFIEFTYSPISHLKLLNKNLFKLIYSTHGSDVLNANTKKRLSRIFWNLLLAPADKVIACSKGLAEQTKNTFPDINNINYIHNGISPSFINSLKESNDNLIGTLKGKQYILSVGTYEYIKGHDILITAFSEIIKIHQDMHLVLIGRNGNEINNLKSITKKLALSANVSIIMDINPSEIAIFFKHAKIYVSASRYESFGIVLLEAGAAKLPVIATETIGAKEIITNNKDGILIPINDPTKLTEALLFYINNPTKMTNYGNTLNNKVKSMFSWKSSMQKYSNL